MEDCISDDRVCIQLDEKLAGLSLISEDSFIFKVPQQLRRIKEKAYEPHIISIGPYHRGKQHLRTMEIYKLHYLKLMLQRSNENDPVKYLDAMRDMEAEARQCYEQPIDVGHDAFAEMMLLDGCFIVQLMMRSMPNRERTEEFLGNDHGDGFVKANASTIMHDLLLLENQLPFSVLLKLFDMMMNYKGKLSNDDLKDYFISMSLVNFAPIMPGPGLLSDRPRQHVNHLLGLVHDHLRPSPQGMERYRPEKPKSERVVEMEVVQWQFIRCASELREAGIKFEKIFKVESKLKPVEVEGDSLLDISFENGKMKIPTLSIYHDTERLFRNLIAYEQFIIGRPKYVTDYITFMDSLINSGKDVEILCRRGIITNWLGDDEVVATIFNRLRDFCFPPGNDFYYSKAFYDVNTHCKHRRNIWKAKLRHDYCNTPWAMISFLAASALLLLALAQTIFAVLSYVK